MNIVCISQKRNVFVLQKGEQNTFVLVLGAYSKVINFCEMMWCRGPTRHNLTKSGPQPNHKSAFILFAWCFLVLKASCEWNVNIFIYILKLNVWMILTCSVICSATFLQYAFLIFVKFCNLSWFWVIISIWPLLLHIRSI